MMYLETDCWRPLDRLTQHAHVTCIMGDSYRQRQRNAKTTTQLAPLIVSFQRPQTP
jgi:hypothetical protein